MRVLVTGGTGFLGSHVVERLIAGGHSVRALVRRTSDTTHLRSAGVDLVTGAIEDSASLPPALVGVDAVVHCAGLVKALDEPAFDRVNADGTRYLLDAVRTSCPGLRRFVLVSSIAAGGPGADGTPVSAYGRSKRRGEEATLATAAALPVTIVRPPPIYGPRDREILPAFRAAARLGLFARLGHPDARFSMIHVEDCAAAIVLALARPHESGAIYPVDDGAVHGWSTLSQALADAVGRRRLRTLPVPRPVTRLACRTVGATARLLRRPSILTEDKYVELIQRDWTCGHEAITRDLAWQPTIGVSEGFERTAAWYRENGWL